MQGEEAKIPSSQPPRDELEHAFARQQSTCEENADCSSAFDAKIFSFQNAYVQARQARKGRALLKEKGGRISSMAELWVGQSR